MQVPVLSGESRLGAVMASDFKYARRKLAPPFLFALHNFRSFDGLPLPGVREFNNCDFVLRCGGIGHGFLLLLLFSWVSSTLPLLELYPLAKILPRSRGHHHPTVRKTGAQWGPRRLRSI